MRARRRVPPPSGGLSDVEAARLWRAVCLPNHGLREWAPKSDHVVAARFRRLAGWVEAGAEVPSTYRAALRTDWREVLRAEGAL